MATHIMGVDIAYECIGNCTYRIHWSAYRDCGGAVAISPNVNFNVISGTGCTAPVPLANWSNQITTEVTPICPGILTQCTTPGAQIRGVQEYYRYRDFDICSSNCIYQITWNDCCRNNAITSGSASQQIFTGQTTINTGISPCNGSPRFSNPPIPYICMGQGFTFNQGAFDPDGDSIAYSLGPCYQGNGNQITYGPGYSPTAPIGPSWNLNLDPTTGDLTITPNPGNLAVGVLCIYVEEYRNGLLIGTVVRDMQITVIDCGPNNLPQTAGVTNVSGGTGSGFNVSTCLGSNLCFDIPIVDLDNGQTVTAWWNQNISGATFITTGGGPQDTISGTNPSGTFCWTPTATGTYTFLLSMEDDNCPMLGSNQYTFTIAVNPPVAVSAVALAQCLDGQFSANPTGGQAPFTFSWSGAGGFSATGSNPIHSYPGPGTYNWSVTVTDANGCNASTTGNITILPPVTVQASSTHATCNGASDGTVSATASGGTGPYTYLWTGNLSGPNHSNLPPGSYTVTVTDAAGCSGTASVVITEPAALQANVSATAPSCNGGADGTATASASGGTPGYTYLWSNAQTTAQATGLSAGTFTVTITDQNGCQATASVTLNAPTPISLSFTATDASCHGSNDGSATVSASGGNGAYTFLWSNGPTTAGNPNLAAGSYSVTVTDANGCTATGSISVSEPSAISLAATLTSPTCNGVPNGTAALAPSGGTSPYTYLWSNGQQTITATSLTAGPWSVTVTDANGCQDSLSVMLSEPDPLTVSTNAVAVSCNGGSDGTVSANPNGGTSPYSYQWSSSQTTAAVGNLASGAYTVTVTDANGCTVVETVLLGEPSAIQLQVSGNGPGCNGGSDGNATVSVSGGSPGYIYAWSNGQTTAQATGLGSGTATVTVTDQNGCTSVGSVNLTDPPAIVLSGSSTDVSCAGGADGNASVSASGGSPGYTYLWSNGAQTSSASGLPAGIHSVQVTDVNGCSASLSITVEEPVALSIQLSGTDISCFGEENGTATALGAGGIPAYTYAWNGGPGTQSISGLGSGWHSVVLTDANGCQISDSILLSEPDPLSVVISGPDRVCRGSRALLDATVQGGTSGYAYSWTSTPAGFTANTAQIGAFPSAYTTYHLLVTDANGCTVQASHSVSVSPLPTADFDAENTSGCDTVTTQFSNLSSGAVAYLWDFGDDTGSNLENPSHQFGNGTLTVTLVAISADGCRDSVVRQDLITVLPTPIADFTTQEDISQAILLSQAEIHFLNASQFANTYLWEFGDGYISPETNPVHSYHEPGSYPVTLYAYNAFGCVDSITKSPILIDPDGSIFAPTAFSPNGDGLNDDFLLKGEGITSYQLVVYNRWGQQVYVSQSINDSWDGRFQGSPSPEGVYIWKLEATILSGKEVSKGGSLTLIR